VVRRVAAIAALALLTSTLWPRCAAAQTSSPDAGQNSPPDFEETVDIVDVVRHLLNKPPPVESSQPQQRTKMRAIAPVVGVKPSTGGMIGIAGNIAFYRGDPATTSISSTIVSATFTTKKQTHLNAHTTMFGAGDRWRFEGIYKVQWTSLETFDLGTNTESPPGDVARYDFDRFHQFLYGRIRPNLFAGGGLVFDTHHNIRPRDGEEGAWQQSPYYEYTAANGFPIDSQQSAGLSAELIWDSRDSFINPGHGSYTRVGYRALFDDFLGGDSRWNKVTIDARAYAPLVKGGGQKLAFWGYADLVVSGVAPYFDLPATGSDPYGRSGRGYAEGHFRGERLAFVEMEYRAPLTRNGLLGMVAFINTTTVANRQTGEELFDHFASGGGGGLRLLLNKRSKTNLAFDVGFGEKGNHGIYLGVQEAF